MRHVRRSNGASYYVTGTQKFERQEYERFQGCLLQLVDEDSLVGNLEGKWVIFKNGWVYGLSAYDTAENALAFARQIFREDTDPSYIVVCCEPEKHALSPMHLLASALSDVDSVNLQDKEEKNND